MAHTDLLRGTLDPLTRGTLAIELQHGWRVSDRIRQVSSELLQIQQGEPYPASQRLRRSGWICLRRGVFDNNHRAKSNELTRIWRNPCEEEARSRYTSPIAVDSVLEIV